MIASDTLTLVAGNSSRNLNQLHDAVRVSNISISVSGCFDHSVILSFTSCFGRPIRCSPMRTIPCPGSGIQLYILCLFDCWFCWANNSHIYQLMELLYYVSIHCATCMKGLCWLQSLFHWEVLSKDLRTKRLNEFLNKRLVVDSGRL